MKKILLAVVMALSFVSAGAQQIMRGETSPGVYTNVAVDGSGNLAISNASQSSTVGSKAAGTAATNSQLVGGVYNTTLPSPTAGQQSSLQIGAKSSLRIQLMAPDASYPVTVSVSGVDAASNASLNAISSVTYPSVFNGTTWDRMRGDTTGVYSVRVASALGGYSFNNITTNATTTIKSGAGYLHTLVINTAGATSSIKCYDNTAASGTVIGTTGSLTQGTMGYDLAFGTGLTCVTTGGTPADVTVTYK